MALGMALGKVLGKVPGMDLLEDLADGLGMGPDPIGCWTHEAPWSTERWDQIRCFLALEGCRCCCRAILLRRGAPEENCRPAVRRRLPGRPRESAAFGRSRE